MVSYLNYTYVKAPQQVSEKRLFRLANRKEGE